MNRIFVVTLLLVVSTSSLPANANSKNQYLSPNSLAVVNSGEHLAIGGKTGEKVLFFDVKSERVLSEVKIKGEINGLVSTKGGEILYVCSGAAPGLLTTIDVKHSKIIHEMNVGHYPCAPALSRDDTKIYICDRFKNEVLEVDLQSKTVIRSLPTSREPISTCFDSTGRFLYVGCHLPDGPANVEYVASTVMVLDTVGHQNIAPIKLVNGAEGVRDLQLSLDGKQVFVVHLVARFNVPTTHLDRGWIITNALSVISTERNNLEYTLLLDDVDRGFANPWAVCIDKVNNTLCISSAGGNELRLIDLDALTQKIKKAPNHQEDLQTHNDLSFISEISKRISLKGIGPRSALFMGDKIFVTEYYTDSLGIVQLGDRDWSSQIRTIPLQKHTEMTLERKGDMFFNDSSLCFQNWLSCASCHSEDARTDGLNWDLLNDGMGNSKNAKSLLYSHFTPPAMATGVRDCAETAVRAGLKYIQFSVRPEEDAKAIDAFLMSLQQVPSPYMNGGQLSEKALNGKRIFNDQGCYRCHEGSYFTNMKKYNLKTGIGQDAEKEFDVPTLREVWRSAPYLHDGRAANLHELFLNYQHGMRKKLSENEIDWLVEYVRSL